LILILWHTRCKQINKVYFVYTVYRKYKLATMVLNKTSQKGLKDGWIRATFILRKDYLEELKALAYWERKKILTPLCSPLKLRGDEGGLRGGNP